MRITLATPGIFKSGELKALVGMYLGRAKRYGDVAHVELALPKKSQAPEEEALLKYMKERGPRARLVVLDERGKLLDSTAFAKTVERWRGDGAFTEVVVALGGPHGYSAELKKTALMAWSLSPMVMAHELAATVAAEQIYRAFTILAGHPYHNDA